MVLWCVSNMFNQLPTNVSLAGFFGLGGGSCHVINCNHPWLLKRGKSSSKASMWTPTTLKDCWRSSTLMATARPGEPGNFSQQKFSNG